MFGMGKKKGRSEPSDKWRCSSHETIVKKLARIEGENVVIIILLSAILLIIAEKMLA